jgi:hypothetical protein
MTQPELMEQLKHRNIKTEVADNGAILCRFPGLENFGLGITPMGDGLDCYAYETYSGSDLGQAGHKTLDGAIAWALLLIVSCDAAMSAELATMKREI